MQDRKGVGIKPTTLLAVTTLQITAMESLQIKGRHMTLLSGSLVVMQTVLNH